MSWTSVRRDVERHNGNRVLETLPSIWPLSKVTNTTKPEPFVHDHRALTHWVLFVFLLSKDYTKELIVAHIRRLLDIVACTTTSFITVAKPLISKSKDLTEPGSENWFKTNSKPKLVDPKLDLANAKSDKADMNVWIHDFNDAKVESNKVALKEKHCFKINTRLLQQTKSCFKIN